MRLVLASDFLLGTPCAHLENNASRRRSELWEAFERVIKIVQEANADYFVIAGNLFDANFVPFETVSRAFKRLGELEGTTVLITPGSRDSIGEGGIYRIFELPDNICIFLTNVPSPITFSEHNVVFWGLMFPPDPALSFEPEEGFTNILISPAGKVMEPIPAGVDAVFVGGMKSSFVVSPEPLVVASGPPEEVDFGEEGFHGVAIVDFTGGGSPKTSFVRTSTRKYREVVLHLCGMETVDEVTDKVKRLLEGLPDSSVVRLRLKGVAGEDVMRLDAEDFPDALRFFHFEFSKELLPAIDVDKLLGRTDVIGLFSREVVGDRSAPWERRMVALYHGVKALGGEVSKT